MWRQAQEAAECQHISTSTAVSCAPASSQNLPHTLLFCSLVILLLCVTAVMCDSHVWKGGQLIEPVPDTVKVVADVWGQARKP